MKHSKRRLFVVLVGLLVFLLGALPAQAVQNSRPDGPRNGNVGVLGVDLGGGLVFPFCSGFVISDSAFVTAGHCIVFPPGTDWVVSLKPGSPKDPVYTPGRLALDFSNIFDFHLDANIHAEHVYVHPGFDVNDLSTYANDVAVLTFPPGTFKVPPVQLPEIGMLDHLSAAGSLTHMPLQMVGYGADGLVTLGDGSTWWHMPGYRQIGVSGITGLTSTHILFTPTSAWPSKGGPGDSGSPQFLAGRAVSLGSPFDGEELRLDTPNVLSFLKAHMS